MDGARRTGPSQSVLVLVLLVLAGAWPLVRLGLRTTASTWVLSGVAASLAAALGFWLWDRRMRLPLSSARALRPWMWIAVALAPAVAIGRTPVGVQMIYSASLEGIVLAITVAVVRTRSNVSRNRPND